MLAAGLRERGVEADGGRGSDCVAVLTMTYINAVSHRDFTVTQWIYDCLLPFLVGFPSCHLLIKALMLTEHY